MEEGWRRVGGRVVEEEGWRRVGGGFEDGWRRVGATGLAEGGRTGLEEGCWPVRLCARKGAVRGRGSRPGQGVVVRVMVGAPIAPTTIRLLHALLLSAGALSKRQQLGWDIAQM